MLIDKAIALAHSHVFSNCYHAEMDINEMRRRKLRQLIQQHGSQRLLASASGMDPSHISQIMTSKRNMGEKLAREVEKSLRLTPGWFDDGADSQANNTSAAPPVMGVVPLISWVQAGEWCDIEDYYHPGQGEKDIYTTRKVGKHAFALRVRGDSMENPKGRPSYPEGAIIIVDPDRPVHSGDRVVVRLEDSAEATFKQYIEDSGRKYLKPLNPQYPMIELDERATICGVVIQTIIDED